MAWDHLQKQRELALAAINRPRPFRPGSRQIDCAGAS